MKTTYFSVLLRYARELSEAESRGNLEEIAKAKEAHDFYKKLCLESDSMSLGMTYGDLHAKPGIR